MVTWDNAAKQAEEISQGVFIKLKDGQKIKGVFCGEPEYKATHFMQENSKPQECIGLPNCVLCKNGVRKSVRWNINIATQDESGEFTMRVIGLSSTIFSRLCAMRNEITTPFEHTCFSIVRKGSGTDTDYIITPLGEISTSAKASIKGLKLHNANDEASAIAKQFDGTVVDEQVPF